MVTFSAVGRLGNFLYECATALAYALRHDLDFTVPFNCTNEIWSPIYLKHLQNDSWNSQLEQVHLWENGHEYSSLEFKEEWRDRNIIIEGYRQSYRYFDDYRREILYLFDFPWEQKDFVSIHIRRGDYLILTDKHPPFSIEYMRAATSKFYLLGYDKFKVFSDDLPWCREHFKDDHYSAMNIEFYSGANEVDDIVEMSCAQHHINSSSTFSLWGAELNRNPYKIVVTPKLWFTENYHLKTHDIIRPEWIKL